MVWMNYDVAVLGAALLFVTLATSRKNGGAALGILIMPMPMLVWPEFVRLYCRYNLPIN